MALTLAEQETVINYSREGMTCTIYTANPYDLAYYDKLCEERPDWIKVVKIYGTYAKMYLCRDRPARLKAPKLAN